MNKKKILFITLFTIIIILSILYVLTNKIKIVLINDLTVEINEKVTYENFIKKTKYGKILEPISYIDTKELGKINISLKTKNMFGIKKYYNFQIEVVDTTSPTIKITNKNLEVTEGYELDLLSNVTVQDNSNENIKVNIEGNYDFNIPSEYKLYYIAKDSSGNESKEEFILKVKEKNNSLSTKENMKDRTFTTNTGFSGEIKNGILYIDGTLIVNKSYYLPSNYGSGLTKKTKEAFNIMANDAKNEGINLFIASGFRNYSEQKKEYDNYVKKNGKSKADTYSARPGHSEHQTGLTIDINVVSGNSFATTKEGIWLNNNAYKYGFILRYPKDKDNITGYMYEPWHYRYIGTNLAEKLYNNGSWISLEEYYGINSKYDYN